jgi:hypothetical protein
VHEAVQDVRYGVAAAHAELDQLAESNREGFAATTTALAGVTEDVGALAATAAATRAASEALLMGQRELSGAQRQLAQELSATGTTPRCACLRRREPQGSLQPTYRLSEQEALTTHSRTLHAPNLPPPRVCSLAALQLSTGSPKHPSDVEVGSLSDHKSGRKHSLSLTHSLSLSHTPIHTHALSHALSLALYLSLTHTHTLHR